MPFLLYDKSPMMLEVSLVVWQKLGNCIKSARSLLKYPAKRAKVRVPMLKCFS